MYYPQFVKNAPLTIKLSLVGCPILSRKFLSLKVRAPTDYLVFKSQTHALQSSPDADTKRLFPGEISIDPIAELCEPPNSKASSNGFLKSGISLLVFSSIFLSTL